MRLWATGFSCVLVLGGCAASFGQEPSGPQTLENLLNSDESQKPAEADATEAGAKRPAGSVVRPKDGVQHPDLDRAWENYNAAVMKAAEGIRATINKQFDAATAKGDLDEAEKWQVIGEKFEKAGELPAETETRTAVNAAVAEYMKAREKLSKAYEVVVKALTMEKKIPDAKTVRRESESLALGSTKNRDGDKPLPERPEKVRKEKVTFLVELPAREVLVSDGHFKRGGDIGFAGRAVSVLGNPSPKAIQMHARANATAMATFDVPKGCTHFEAVAAIDDGAERAQKTPLVFKVYGDGRQLWNSKPLWAGREVGICKLAVNGVKKITLEVECLGPSNFGWAVWCDPRFLAK